MDDGASCRALRDMALARRLGLAAPRVGHTLCTAPDALATPPPVRAGWRPIRKLLAANRGEIAIRICRAATDQVTHSGPHSLGRRSALRAEL